MNSEDNKDSLIADTTAEQDRRTKSQRGLNMVWEYTQALIAIIVTVVTCLGVFIKVIYQQSSPFPAEWWTIQGLVIGFYFSRTNHARIGSLDTR